MKPIISIIAPMYNEQDIVCQYCKEVLTVMKSVKEKYDMEVLLVNDGSTDGTLDVMKKMYNMYIHEITIVNLSRNFGLEGAIDAGLRAASGEAVIVMDADLQDPPKVILELLEKWEQGFDIVSAKRIKRQSDSLFKRASASLFYCMQSKLSGRLKLEHNAANFRLLSRRAVDLLLSFPEVNRSFRVLVPFMGMKTAFIEYERDKRYAGKTKYNISSMIRYALDSLTGTSIEILRKIIWLVPLFAFTAFAGGMGIVLGNPGERSYYIIIFLIGSSNMLLSAGMAIMAEYIGQIMLEIKRRPSSIIYEIIPRIIVGD